MDPSSAAAYLNNEVASSSLQGELKKKAVRGVSVTVASRLAENAINMLSIIVLARLLTPKDFGLVAMVASVSSIFSVFRDLGLGDATIRAPQITHEQVNSLFWINTLFGTGTTLVFIILSPLIALFFKEPQLTTIAIFSSLSFLFTGLYIQHIALLRRRMEFTKLAVLSIASAVVSVIAAISLAAFGFGYRAIVARQVVLSLGLALGAWVFCKWKPGRPSFRGGVRPMVVFGVNIIGFYIMNYFALNLDKTLIGWKSGAKPLGFYDRAYQLSGTPVETLTIPVQSVAVSTLSKLVGDPDNFKRFYLNALSVLAFIVMPLSAFLTVAGKDIVRILLGPQWSASGGVFMILSAGIGVHILYATQGWLHITLGRTDRWVKWGLVATPIIIASYVLGFHWGITGVAMFRTGIFLILMLPSLWYAGRPINLRVSSILAEVWRYAFCALLSGILCAFLVVPRLAPLNIWLRIFLSLISYLVVYLGFIVIVLGNVAAIKKHLSLLKLLRSDR